MRCWIRVRRKETSKSSFESEEMIEMIGDISSDETQNYLVCRLGGG